MSDALASILADKTSISVLLIAGPKCTLTASHAAPHGEYADGTDRQTDGHQTGKLRFPLWTASSIATLLSVSRNTYLNSRKAV